MKTSDLTPPGSNALDRVRGRKGKRAGTPGPRIMDAEGNDVVSPDVQFIGATVSGEDGELAIVTITGTGQQVINDSGTDLEYGMVVVRQSDGSVTTTTTERDTRPVGVVQIGGADADPVSVVFSGDVAQITTTGTVAAGDYLETSTTAGKAQSSGTSRRSGTFGRALDADPDPPATLFGVTDAVTGSVGGSGQPWLYAQADGGCAGDGVTDDTAALQALINAATANGTQSGWIFFEPGVYLIGGALQDTGDFNGQILLPENTGSTKHITLTLEGPSRARYSGARAGYAEGDAILRSTLTGGSGTAAVFSAGNTTSNRLSLVIRNLTCVAPDNPSLTFWNLLQTKDGLREGLLIGTEWTFTGTGAATEPTHSNAYGIKLPANNQSAHAVEEIWVSNFYTGVLHCELDWGDYVVWQCKRAVELSFSHHIGGHIRLQTLACPRGIVVTGANQLDIIYDAEHYSAAAGAGFPNDYPAWTAGVYDLDDASNLLSGHIRWWGVEGGVGVDHIFLVNGGANVAREEMGDLPDAGSINGVAITGTPTTGSVPVASSSTAAAWSAGSAVGEILISDSPAGSPLVFGDLLQNEAQDDLVYADL